MGHGGTKNISGRRSSTCKNSAKPYLPARSPCTDGCSAHSCNRDPDTDVVRKKTNAAPLLWVEPRWRSPCEARRRARRRHGPHARRRLRPQAQPTRAMAVRHVASKTMARSGAPRGSTEIGCNAVSGEPSATAALPTHPCTRELKRTHNRSRHTEHIRGDQLCTISASIVALTLGHVLPEVDEQ